ncbi:hypothetical protein VTN02DRAFT_5939 [Thermoascus thermophilus]
MASLSALAARGLYSDVPPDIETRLHNNPTLLMSWWATCFSLAVILVRVCGRYIRTERLFREDRVMLTSVAPLMIRMALVHVVLIWGTNNTKTAGLTELDIRRREIGSKLVLAARIFYAVFVWTAKYTVCEFLKRLTENIWRRSFQLVLKFIYYFLASTLIAVVIATLVECQPFDHYWQVVPDPGPKCRSGYANLITMGTCDVITDLLLVAFPIPLVLLTSMPLRRKISLVLLFAMSIILVAVTCYRVPSVIRRNGSQQFRSLIASLEIWVATAVSNAIVIGSFVRDRGVKKPKFKKALVLGSATSSLDRGSVRRAMISHHHWGSDADLACDLGIRLDPSLYSNEIQAVRPAPVVLPTHPLTAQAGTVDPNWTFRRNSDGTDDDRASTDSFGGGQKINPREYIETNTSPGIKSAGIVDPSMISPRKVSFFDVGGLLEASPETSSPPSLSQDPASYPEPRRYRRGSAALLQDVGGLLPSPSSHDSAPRNFSLRDSRNGAPFASSALGGSRMGFPSPWETPVPPYRPDSDVTGPVMEGNVMELQEPGGLLSQDRAAGPARPESEIELQDVGGLLSRTDSKPG